MGTWIYWANNKCRALRKRRAVLIYYLFTYYHDIIMSNYLCIVKYIISEFQTNPIQSNPGIYKAPISSCLNEEIIYLKLIHKVEKSVQYAIQFMHLSFVRPTSWPPGMVRHGCVMFPKIATHSTVMAAKCPSQYWPLCAS